MRSYTDALKSRYTTIKREIQAQYRPDIEAMHNRHAEAEKDADRQRQMRAAERDQAANRLDQTITKIERSYSSLSQRRDRGPDFG